MFGNKARRSFTVATDAFVHEMLRAILKDELKTDVYLTQVKIKAEKAQKLEKRIATRQFAHEVLRIEVEAFFTSLDFPRRHGYELHRGGVLANSPKVFAKLSFTNEASGWYNWELFSAKVDFIDFYPPNTHGSIFWSFEPDASTTANPTPRAPLHLLQLSQELQHRGPSRLRDDR